MSSVTLVHPAKASGRNKMPFGRDALMVPSNTVLERAPIPTPEGDIWEDATPSSQRCHLLPSYFALVIALILNADRHQSCHVLSYVNVSACVSRRRIRYEMLFGERDHIPCTTSRTTLFLMGFVLTEHL